MIDQNTEKLLTPVEAAKFAGNSGRGGTHPNKATMYRWMTSGYKGILLETVQVPGGLRTSREALQRFFERITAAKNAARAAFDAVVSNSRQQAGREPAGGARLHEPVGRAK
jgi:hypothetical protein